MFEYFSAFPRDHRQSLSEEEHQQCPKPASTPGGPVVFPGNVALVYIRLKFLFAFSSPSIKIYCFRQNMNFCRLNSLKAWQTIQLYFDSSIHRDGPCIRRYICNMAKSPIEWVSEKQMPFPHWFLLLMIDDVSNLLVIARFCCVTNYPKT